MFDSKGAGSTWSPPEKKCGLKFACLKKVAARVLDVFRLLQAVGCGEPFQASPAAF